MSLNFVEDSSWNDEEQEAEADCFVGGGEAFLPSVDVLETFLDVVFLGVLVVRITFLLDIC